jgi:myo-inositol catabolism protein IolS
LEQLKEANKYGGVDVIENYYNLLHRDAEKEMFTYLTEQHIAFVPYFPLQSGLLTGKYTETTTFQDLRSQQEDFQGDRFKENVRKVEQLRPIATAHGVEIANIVLAYYLTKDPIVAVIPGAKRPEQLHANLRTLDVQLTADEIATIDSVFPL